MAKSHADQMLKLGHISPAAHAKMVGKGALGQIQSKDAGDSATKSDPDGLRGVADGLGKKPADDGANPRKEPRADKGNDSAEQRGDMSDGADGAAKDRFWPGSGAGRKDRAW
jgi:hypothetical protein